MRAHQAIYPVATMCRVLGVSTSGYYAWRCRGASARARADAKLTERIEHYHRRSDGTYGVPRIHADLAEEGWQVGVKRVARLMRASGLRGVCRRKSARTTIRDEQTRPVPDLVNRRFEATGAQPAVGR